MATSVRIKVHNNKLPLIAKKLPNQVGEIVQGAAQEALKVARTRVPVLTGALKASITVQTKGLEAVVKSDLVYAAIIEYGGVNRPAQPYMRPAAVAGRIYIQKGLSKLAGKLEHL